MHVLNPTHMDLARKATTIKIALCLILLIGLAPAAMAFQTASLDSATLAGNWKIDYTQSYDKVTTSQKAELNKLSQSHRDQLKVNQEGMTYHFDANGTFTISLAAGASVSGTWQLNSAGDLLDLNYVIGTVLSYEVKGATSTTLHLKLTGQFPPSIIFQELYLIKQ